MNKKQNDGERKFFHEQVKRSGHYLENRVGNLLQKAGYSIDREFPYIDKDESEGRTIDLIARAEIPESYGLEAKTRSYVTIKEDCNSNWCSLLWKGTATELLADLESVAAELKINTRR